MVSAMSTTHTPPRTLTQEGLHGPYDTVRSCGTEVCRIAVDSDDCSIVLPVYSSVQVAVRYHIPDEWTVLDLRVVENSAVRT